MLTQIFSVLLNDDQTEEYLKKAAFAIQTGGLVVFPTETVYGLGGDATNPSAAKKIYAAKGRPSDNPLIIHVSTPEETEKYAITCPLFYKLAKAFMPGPLTIILPKKDIIPLSVTGGLDTVAVRCPSHPIAHRLIKLAGVPIAAPSANISGKPSPTQAEHVIHDLMDKVDIILAGDECEIGLESTIVKIDNQNHLTILRPGAITFDALCCVVDNVDIAPAVVSMLSENEKPLSPGMKYRHYAPSAPMILLDGAPDDVLHFCINEAKNKNALFLCYDDESSLIGREKCIPIGQRNDYGKQAHLLFAALREADTYNIDVIYAHLPPMEGMGLALYNRMIRAAAHTIKKI